MTETIRNRVGRLERALGVADWPPATSLAALPAEEFDAALALALAATTPGDRANAMVNTPGAVPPAMTEAVEQARALMQAALALGWARFGFQSERARYLDAPLAEMLPEPRSPAATAMVAAIEEGNLPFIVRRFIPVLKGGRPAPDGWRSA